jgi:hypothetical protein
MYDHDQSDGGAFFLDSCILNGSGDEKDLLVLLLLQQGPALIVGMLAEKSVQFFGSRWLVAVTVACQSVLLLFIFRSEPLVKIVLYFCLTTCTLVLFLERSIVITKLIAPKDIVSFNLRCEKWTVPVRSLIPLAAALLVTTSCNVTCAVLLLFSGLLALSMTVLSSRAALRKNTTRHHQVVLQRSRSDISQPTGFHVDFSTGELFGLVIFLLFGGGLFNFALPLFYRNSLNLPVQYYGALLSAFQVGGWLATMVPLTAKGIAIGKIQVKMLYLLLFAVCGTISFLSSVFLLAGFMVVFGYLFTTLHIALESLILIQAQGLKQYLLLSRLTLVNALSFIAAALTGMVMVHSMSPVLLIGTLVPVTFLAGVLWIVQSTRA